ncbi:MAG TPA: MBL fold metallo-hydrolase [Solirubrobacteraceae bacterium]|nr:MBL fold metallo-hydrolase [Solirubrobacteraceae bacterium]
MEREHASTPEAATAAIGEPELIDLLHLDRARVISSWLVGDVLVDPGPSSCMDRLLEALDGREPRVLALTHIHLDHAGATGSLLERFPHARAWVHERGAPHLLDPTKLLASASRLYGERMETLWGEVLPVPAERVDVLRGGEIVEGFRVAYTPGHASHHLAYLHEPSGYAFVGDVAGVRVGAGPVLAPTPPPDIDLPAWRRSLEVIQGWHPRMLVPTHFGSYGDADEQIEALREELARVEALASELDEAGFVAAMRRAFEAAPGAREAASYAQALPPGQSYHGLARFLARRDAT